MPMTFCGTVRQHSAFTFRTRIWLSKVVFLLVSFWALSVPSPVFSAESQKPNQPTEKTEDKRKEVEENRQKEAEAEFGEPFYLLRLLLSILFNLFSFILCLFSGLNRLLWLCGKDR